MDRNLIAFIAVAVVIFILVLVGLISSLINHKNIIEEFLNDSNDKEVP